MLDVQQLSRSYGDFLAVDQVSFQIKKGEIVGLLGHNGAGKTTIMKMLAGYLEPHQGRIQFNNINLLTDPKIAQRQLGYLPENLPVYPEMLVIDYLDYMASLKQIPTIEKRLEIGRVIHATHLEDKAFSAIGTLSRGLKQRVGVAQAILGEPHLLILDEPTNGLDPNQTDHMRQLIQSLAESATVLLSTHIMQEVEAVCGRVLILDHGRLVVDESLLQLQQGNTVRLATSLEPTTLKQVLQSVSGIIEIHPVEHLQTAAEYVYQLTLSLREPEYLRQICGHVAQAIISQQGQLFALQPEQHNLESRFREVTSATISTQENFAHAH